jgi:hypothetical protein
VNLGNSARDRAIRGKMLKDMGVKPGVPDLVLCYWILRGVLSFQQTLWIELKSTKGKQSEDQAIFSTKVEGLGHHYHICRSLDDVIHVLRVCEVPVKSKRSPLYITMGRR